MSASQLKDRIGAGISALVGFLVFGGVGLLAGWVIWATVDLGWRAEGWAKVRADVNAWSDGDVAYTYDWNGRKYTGTRLGTFVLGGTSEVDDWEARIDTRLTEALEQKKPITVLVDPANPAESIADGEIRWKLLLVFLPFAVGFTGAGLAIFASMGRRALGLQRSLLTEPARTALTQWAVALGWNLITAPVALLAIPSLVDEREWLPVGIIGVLAFLGVLMVVGALFATVRMIRAGNPFNMAGWGHVGRQVRGGAQ